MNMMNRQDTIIENMSDKNLSKDNYKKLKNKFN